ncbi:hypothetical protein ISF_04071 [Cordyceps fumosorosea ARSEF 2679]|uniref:Uncharacterized protein n=1 Tax=Cordyceps fumosorosea (strain ARSEF 2679) TaxID=1081104 RepID=A0A167YE91_CORFA|nr:hypothetical protein ISF_04071 [Cordyceps fumosorosea ARSEF 2679]OAA66233.1 hypothetical protein ISF_04071 [Cordyceps fumosorosea ARSEF 2679]
MDTLLPHEEADFVPPSHRDKPYTGSGLLSKLPFMKPALEAQQAEAAADDSSSQGPGSPHSSSATAQPKTRRRRGSLRKVALLGRGAQRDRRDGSKPLAIDTAQATAYVQVPGNVDTTLSISSHDALGLKTTEIQALAKSSASPRTHVGPGGAASPERDADPQITQDTSTTDEDDILHISHNAIPPRPNLSASSSGSESYFAARGSSPRRSPFQPAKSPLSYSGISTNTIPNSEADWDYAETEWWGWVVLTVTWLVFVIGMGSCLDIWSWAWDVGKTPYAPPELEDDPTLPIVGYYPALMILTCVMAWVWVVVAWVGMKYFRHAKISGD